MTTLIFGHKAPDTDATGSPLIWAWYLSTCRATPAEARMLEAPNTEAAFVLDRWGYATPPKLDALDDGQKVVVVDTNNPEELPDSIGKAEITQIIDHHKLAGGLTTASPIEITVRPLACTATIMHDLMGDDAHRMDRGTRGLMLSCILSDTLAFRSPTTTDADRNLAERLAADLELDIEDYAAEMFAAKSDVSDFSEAELLRMDSKLYDVGSKKMRVSVLETTAPDQVLKRKDDLKAAMPKVAEADGVDDVLLFLIDILEGGATLIVQNDQVKTVAEKSFDAKVEGDTVVLPGVMSRKKQIVPNLKA